jgi:glycosyltransferase involved in cell wall biosynthesis
MSGRPLVSVVTSFLDAERFLEEAVTSVFRQTYDRWELVLVDDGSTDGSSEIARRFARERPGQVRYVEHEGHRNRGTAASRNVAVRRASGSYVAILDADDVWLPDKLERQVAILEAHSSAGMVCGAAEYWRSWTGSPEDVGQDLVLPVGAPADTLIEPPDLLRILYPLGAGTAPCPSDLLVRRQVVEAVGGFEEEFRGPRQLYEDQAFLAKVYLRTPVFVSGACLFRYRLHPESCVSWVTKAGQYHAIRAFFLRWFEDYLSRRGLEGTEVWQRVQQALWRYRHPVLHRATDAWERARRGVGSRARQLAWAVRRRAGALARRVAR